MVEIKGNVHFSIPATDLDRSQVFYVDTLGFELVSRVKRYIFLRSNKDYFAVAQSHVPVDPNPGDEHNVHHAFLVEDYDACVNWLNEIGLTVFKEDVRDVMPFPGRSAYIHDPDRNVIEFIEVTDPNVVRAVTQENSADSA